MTAAKWKTAGKALGAAAALMTLVSCAGLPPGSTGYTGYDMSNAYALPCQGFEGASLEACRRAGVPMGASGD
jgi:hypothetical protein